MRCQQKLQRQGGRHHGAPLLLHSCKTICIYTSWVMHVLHTIGSDAP
jgi:hypothetical protein